MSTKIVGKDENLKGELIIGNKDMAMTVIVRLMEDFEIDISELSEHV